MYYFTQKREREREREREKERERERESKRISVVLIIMKYEKNNKETLTDRSRINQHVSEYSNKCAEI